MIDYENIETKRLRELAEIFSGFAFKAEDLSAKEGIPVLKIANIQDKVVTKEIVSKFPFNKYQPRLAKFKYQKNDTLVAMTGEGSVGKFGKMRSPDGDYLVNQRVGIIRSFTEKIDPEYLYQVLTLPQYEEALYQLGLGAGQPNVSPKDIGSLFIPYTETNTQQRIASTLSAYDDLIEVNNQRIKLLEETARELYKEWFVRMRFPGYKKSKLVKGLPESWDIVPVANAFETTGGGTPDTSNESYWDGDINWYSPTDITASETFFLSESKNKITEKGLKESSSKLFPAGCLMMTSRATIGALGINTTPACTNQGFITCIPNEQFPKEYLYFWILSNKEYFEMLASGATFLEISRTTFRKINILKPDITLIKKYREIVAPIFQQIENLQSQNVQLRQIRDRLLPRLISGKLKID